MSNRNGYSVGNVAGTVHKPGDSDFNRTMREELFHNWQYRYDGGIGFGAAWLTGVANREFNIDGTIEYDKKGNLKGVQNGDILAFTSGTPSNSSNGFWDSVVDWT